MNLLHCLAPINTQKHKSPMYTRVDSARRAGSKETRRMITTHLCSLSPHSCYRPSLLTSVLLPPEHSRQNSGYSQHRRSSNLKEGSYHHCHHPRRPPLHISQRATGIIAPMGTYLPAEKIEDRSWKDNREVIHEKNSGRANVFRFLSTKTEISIFARTSQRQSLLPSEMKDDLRRLSSRPRPAMNLQSPAAHLHTHFPHLPISIEAFSPLRIAASVTTEELQHQKKKTSLQRTGHRRELPNYLPDRHGLLASILDHFHQQALQEMKTRKWQAILYHMNAALTSETTIKTTEM